MKRRGGSIEGAIVQGAKRNNIRATVTGIDFDHLQVVPAGTTKAIDARLIGSVDSVKVGDLVDITFTERGVVAYTGVEAASAAGATGALAARFSESGTDPIKPISIGAAKTSHRHDAEEIATAGLDADLLDGKHAGNLDGQIPVSNGVLNVNLNAAKLNGLTDAAYVVKTPGPGNTTISGGNAVGNSLTLRGTSHPTKTGSYVILQNGSGNVGVGTTVPKATLHIQSNKISLLDDADSDLKIGNYISGSEVVGGAGALLTFAQKMSAVIGAFRIGGIRGYKSTVSGSFGGGLQFLYQPNSDVDMAPALTMNHNGYVGIGTSTPVAPLDVKGVGSYSSDQGGQMLLHDNTTPLKQLNVGIDGSLGTYGSGFIHAIWSGSVRLPLLLNSFGGNVGIGTTTPTVALDVVGDMSASKLTGWNDAKAVWTYAAANQIYIPAGGLEIYSVGDKLKFTQSGTVKYFYVVAVYNTVLVITGGSDCVVANAAITANYFSKSETPTGFQHWFNWTPTIVGWSTPPTVYTRFKINGRTCNFTFYCTGVGGSNSTSFNFTIPVTARNTGASYLTALPYAVDNGASVNGAIANVDSGSAICTLYKAGYTAWTASGGKAANFQASYEI